MDGAKEEYGVRERKGAREEEKRRSKKADLIEN
jgi:hypothetical protein